MAPRRPLPIDRRRALSTFWLCVGTAAVVAIPEVAGAIGVPALGSAALVTSYGVRSLATVPFTRWLGDHRRALIASDVVEVIHGLAIVVGLVVASGDPMSPIWSLGAASSAESGAQYEQPRNVAHAALHSLGPLSAIPFFLALGRPMGAAVGAPVVFALVGLVAYLYPASRKIAIRADFARRDALREETARERVTRERAEIAETLGRSVGLSLAVAARRTAAGAPDVARRDADREVAAAARRGLAELRAMLERLSTETEPPGAPARATDRMPLYRPFPRARRDRAWSLSRRDTVSAFRLAAGVAALVAVPDVSDGLGLERAIAVPILSLFPVWLAFLTVLPDRVRSSARFHEIAYVASVALATTISAAMPAASGDPTTALWALAVMYAAFNGSDYEVEASWLHLALHGATPVATIPVFLALGAPTAPAIGAPVVFSCARLLTFHHGALRARSAREARAEIERLGADLVRMRAARERELIARDLHDTVGANLSLAAVYADLLEQRRDDPHAVRALSAALGEATEQSLDHLRSLLEGLTPSAPDLTGLAEILRAGTTRLCEAAGVAIEVRVETEGAAPGPAAGHAILRIAQEAISNALRHSGARRVEVVISSDAREVAVRVRDDGRGLDGDTRKPGRGLPNMRRRAEGLGGELRVESGADGTSVTARIPARGAS